MAAWAAEQFEGFGGRSAEERRPQGRARGAAAAEMPAAVVAPGGACGFFVMFF